MKSLTVIIPVSKREPLITIQNSINAFQRVDFTGFNEKIVYVIDVPEDTAPYYQNLKPSENMELLWVMEGLKQSGAYNEGLRKYPDSDFYAFFDTDAIPAIDFFVECMRVVNADFVSCDRHVLNTHQNSITETIKEEYDLCNSGRKIMQKQIGKFFPASCTGLIRGKVFDNFRFTEKTSADSELYRHILHNDFTMRYAFYTCYLENAPTTIKELYSQRLRWLSDTWRTCIATVGSGNSWKENLTNLAMYKVGMFPLIGFIVLLPYAKHVLGYNFVFHSVFMQYISIVALIKTIRNDEVEWK